MAGDVGILRRKDDNSFRDIKDIVNILMSRGFTSESLYDYGNCYMFSVNKPDYDDDFRWYLDDRSSWAIMYINIIKREHSYCFTVEDSSGKKIDYYRYVYIEGSGDRGFMYLNFYMNILNCFRKIYLKGKQIIYIQKKILTGYMKKKYGLGIGIVLIRRLYSIIDTSI